MLIDERFGQGRPSSMGSRVVNDIIWSNSNQFGCSVCVNGLYHVGEWYLGILYRYIMRCLR